MAKRARGTPSRPGQRAPLSRSSAVTRSQAIPVTRPITLTQDEEARAAKLEAQILAAEREAEAAQRRARARREPPVGTALGGGSIALRASEEYRYVVRDLRRITLIGGSLVGALVGIWALSLITGFRFA